MKKFKSYRADALIEAAIYGKSDNFFKFGCVVPIIQIQTKTNTFVLECFLVFSLAFCLS